MITFLSQCHLGRRALRSVSSAVVPVCLSPTAYRRVYSLRNLAVVADTVRIEIDHQPGRRIECNGLPACTGERIAFAARDAEPTASANLRTALHFDCHLPFLSFELSRRSLRFVFGERQVSIRL